MGMARIKVSTTVDEGLLGSARQLRSGLTDASLIDAALRALSAGHRTAEIDVSYAEYGEHSSDEPDEWGDWLRSARPLLPREAHGPAPRPRGTVVVRAPRHRPPSRHRTAMRRRHPKASPRAGRSMHHDRLRAAERGRARTPRRPGAAAICSQPRLSREHLDRGARRAPRTGQPCTDATELRCD